MRKSVILVAALAVSVISQVQAAPARHHGRHVTHVALRRDPVPAKKNPLCNNRFEKQNLGWQEYYHCF